MQNERYCIDVLTQIGALSAPLDSLALTLLTEHIHHRMLAAVADAPERATAALGELLAVLATVRR